MSIIFISYQSNHSDDWSPKLKIEDEVLLYNRLKGEMFSYDVKEKEIITLSNKKKHLQYGFNEINSNIYTTGSSKSGFFKIIEKDDKKIDTLLSFPNTESIFPMALKDENIVYFVKNYIDPKTTQEIYDKRGIYEFNKTTNKLTPFDNTKGILIYTSSAYIDDYLYFIATEDTSNNKKTNLYKLDTSDFSNNPEIILNDLQKSDIYKYQNQLLISNNESIFNLDKTMIFNKKNLFNSFYGDYLIQISSNNETSLTLFIEHLKTHYKFSIDDFIDFTFKDDILTIYTKDKIKSIYLGN
ncbi:MAG: hypothetical protein ACRCZK_05010 [Oscillospiraceae bacterium]